MFDLDVEQVAEGAAQRLTESMNDDAVVAAICVVGILLIFARLLWRRFFRRGSAKGGMAGGWSLSQPILWWSETEALTLGNTFEGIFFCGATGSGKTTGSGEAICEGLMDAGAGGFVSTVKPGDPEYFVKLARRTGRSKDVILFGPRESYNVIEEASRQCGIDLVENEVELFGIAHELIERGSARSGSGQEDSAFWTAARNQLLRNSLVAINLAYGRTTVDDLFAFVTSLPMTLQQVKSNRWRQKSFCYRTFLQAEKNCRPEQERDLITSFNYCMRQLPGSGDRTLGNVLLTLTSMVDIWARGLAHQMLCSKTTVTAEMMEHGKIIVMNVPIAKYGITGRLIQGMVRYCFQRAMLRRDVRRSPRPVFFWADEAQYIANSFDVTFLSTCRSSRIANCYLTQNLPGMYSAFGGLHKGKAEADAILANLNLKLWHAQNCPLTNSFAASSIGESIQARFSANNSYQPTDVLTDVFGWGAQPTMSAGYSEQLQPEVLQSELTRLSTGGPHNNYVIQAIASQAGRVFADTGRTWRRVSFRQKV